jgi:MFS family permease
VAVISMAFDHPHTLKVKERPEFTGWIRALPPRQGAALHAVQPVLPGAGQRQLYVDPDERADPGRAVLPGRLCARIGTIPLLACLFIPLMIGVPVTTLIRARMGVVGAQQVMLVIAGVGLLLIVVVPVPLIPACIALAGFGLAGPQTLTNVLFAQVADEDELRSGVRREGAFFGVNALITKPAQSVALALSPFILEATSL